MISLLAFVALLLPVDDFGYYQNGKILCKQRSEVRHFGDCMQGPPFMCWPLHRHDGTVDSWWRFGPNDKPVGIPYVCGGRAGSCSKHDWDMDGDVDLHDFALLARHYWKGPPRPQLRLPASQTWDGTYDNLPYVRRAAQNKLDRDKKRAAHKPGCGSCMTRICSIDEAGRRMEPSSCQALEWTCVPQ